MFKVNFVFIARTTGHRKSRLALFLAITTDRTDQLTRKIRRSAVFLRYNNGNADRFAFLRLSAASGRWELNAAAIADLIGGIERVGPGATRGTPARHRVPPGALCGEPVAEFMCR